MTFVDMCKLWIARGLVGALLTIAGVVALLAVCLYIEYRTGRK